MLQNGQKRTSTRTRGWSAALCAGLALATVGAAQAADTYPSRAIRIVLTQAPGGVADIIVRLVAQKMSESMGQPVVVENRPGAAMAVAAAAVKNSEPDGYTLLQNGNASAISTALFKTLPYDVLKDFDQVSMLGTFNIALITTPGSKFKSVADVISYAKANPGKLNIASISAGTTQYLSAELFKSMAGLDAQVVPFKSTAEVLNALRGGSVDLAFEILTPIMGQLQARSLVALGMTAGTRFEGFPDVPTIAESGVKGYEAASWNGIAVLSGTPRPIIDRLNKEINAALADPVVHQRLVEVGVGPHGGTPEESETKMVNDIAKWKKVVHDAGIPQQ